MLQISVPCNCCSQICATGLARRINGNPDQRGNIYQRQKPRCCDKECEDQCVNNKKVKLADCSGGECQYKEQEYPYSSCCTTTEVSGLKIGGCVLGQCEPGATTSCGTCGVRVCKDDCT